MVIPREYGRRVGDQGHEKNMTSWLVLYVVRLKSSNLAGGGGARVYTNRNEAEKESKSEFQNLIQ